MGRLQVQGRGASVVVNGGAQSERTEAGILQIAKYEMQTGMAVEDEKGSENLSALDPE